MLFSIYQKERLFIFKQSNMDDTGMVDELKRKIRNLWVKALKGSGKAYRELGILFIRGKACRKDRTLARLCLDKAAEMGDEQGYLLYHKLFSGKKKVIDDLSYEDMMRDLQNARSRREKKWLERYLGITERREN